MNVHQDIYLKALCRKAQAAMKLKNFDSALESITNAKNLSKEEEVDKLYKIILIEHETLKKSLEIFDSDCENFM